MQMYSQIQMQVKMQIQIQMQVRMQMQVQMQVQIQIHSKFLVNKPSYNDKDWTQASLVYHKIIIHFRSPYNQHGK